MQKENWFSVFSVSTRRKKVFYACCTCNLTHHRYREKSGAVYISVLSWTHLTKSYNAVTVFSTKNKTKTKCCVFNALQYMYFSELWSCDHQQKNMVKKWGLPSIILWEWYGPMLLKQNFVPSETKVMWIWKSIVNIHTEDRIQELVDLMQKTISQEAQSQRLSCVSPSLFTPWFVGTWTVAFWLIYHSKFSYWLIVYTLYSFQPLKDCWLAWKYTWT